MASKPIREGLFETVSGKPLLLASRCENCRETIFPTCEVCPNCSDNRMQEISLNAKGRLYSYTVVRKKPPDYLGSVPFAFGVVELPEGLRINSLLTTYSDLELGMEMDLSIEKLYTNEQGVDITTFMFKPVN